MNITHKQAYVLRNLDRVEIRFRRSAVAYLIDGRDCRQQLVSLSAKGIIAWPGQGVPAKIHDPDGIVGTPWTPWTPWTPLTRPPGPDDPRLPPAGAAAEERCVADRQAAPGWALDPSLGQGQRRESAGTPPFGDLHDRRSAGRAAAGGGPCPDMPPAALPVDVVPMWRGAHCGTPARLGSKPSDPPPARPGTTPTMFGPARTCASR